MPIGGAQAIRRAAAEYDGERVVGLCDHNEERYFRRVLGDATFVCVKDIEDELIRAAGVERVEEVVAAQGELDTFRKFQDQLYWRGRPVDAQLRRWLQNGGRYLRYPPLLVAALEPDEIPAAARRRARRGRLTGLEPTRRDSAAVAPSPRAARAGRGGSGPRTRRRRGGGRT